MIRLDHLVLPVESLEPAADTLARNGFVVTPQTEHPFGTANRLVVFENAYVELVTVVDLDRLPPAGFARRVAEHLASGAAGFSHVACAADSVTDAGDDVRRNDGVPGEPMWFSRRAPRSDGSELTASFTLLPIDGVPEVFFCVHHTPTAVWFGPHLRHPNGAERIRHASTSIVLPFEVDPVDTGGPAVESDGSHPPFDIGGVWFSGRSALEAGA